ncbi:hypothetical protein V9N52_004343, partial [Vibrio navarrensis]
FPASGWFGGQGPQDEAFEVKLAKVDSEASEIVTTVDGEPSHESALEVDKGSEVKVEAEFHFEDGSHYTTSSSEFVTWTVTPEESGVTVDENGNIDTSGVTVTGEESVTVVITATGHGPFDGVSKTTTLTVTPSPYPEGSIEVPGVGVFTKPLTTAQADSLGVTYSSSAGDIGESWAVYNPTLALAMCSQLGYRLATADELIALYETYPDMQMETINGWPVSRSYWSSNYYTPDGSYYRAVSLGNGYTTGYGSESYRFYASCVSGS